MVVVEEQVVAQESGEERREGSSNYETVSFFPTNGGVLQKEIAGLIDGTEYAFQVQAGNSVDCGSWSSSGYGTPIGPPNQVSVPTLTPGNRELTVIWTARNNGGAAITGYGIQYGIAPNPPSWTGITPSGLSTQYTIAPSPGLTNGTTYEVQVRACNRPEGCGDWSSSDTGTPMVPRLARPEDLDVTPLRFRKVKLSWPEVTNADGYVVQARDPLIVTQPQEAWNAWTTLSGTVTCRSRQVPLAGICETEFGLDQIIHSRGLADADAYELQVRATDSTGARPRSLFSDEITIIDTPITRVNGDSRGNNGPDDGGALVEWSAVSNVTEYSIRWRRLPLFGGIPPDIYTHRTLGWRPQPAAGGHAWSGPHIIQRGTLEDTIEDLRLEEIYAIQLNYEYAKSPGTSVRRKGFSAREAFVWPSDRAADGGERVATFPLNINLPHKTYSYAFCDGTFPTATVERWKNSSPMPLVSGSYQRIIWLPLNLWSWMRTGRKLNVLTIQCSSAK